MTPIVWRRSENGLTYSLLRGSNHFGIEEVDLGAPPLRFWDDQPLSAPALLEIGIDQRRVKAVASPIALLRQLPDGDTWSGMTRRSLARLAAWFLVCEDRQGRLRAQPVATLAHQASLVRHVLSQPSLGRVLIADEVGLGKTVEVGLIVKGLMASQPGLRICYLAPARLVANVHRELQRLGLPFRQWVATDKRDATLQDSLLIASIHRAVHEAHLDEFLRTPPWDVIIVDECHHLSDWEPHGGKPVRQYKLVQELLSRQQSGGRLILMSGTPHQGHRYRFENLLALLTRKEEAPSALAGRVIYRTKDDARDWDGHPVFPARQINEPYVIDLGPAHREWLRHIHDFYVPHSGSGGGIGRRRAAGWRCAQALQWASSSVHAGLGYLIRQAIRAGWDSKRSALVSALESIRPYRLGPSDEPVHFLFERIRKEVIRQVQDRDLEDIEDIEEESEAWEPDPVLLASLLEEGRELLRQAPDSKWKLLYERIVRPAGEEKVVLFAQPIETVTALAGFLQRATGRAPAMIIGSQPEAVREGQIRDFWRPDGPQYLVSSRAGGEGINLQIARRLVHVDVPWNPMELEQRVGRVHRFGSRQRILVDTVVAKDSREVDMYRVARSKLHEIARSLVPNDRFEGLFSRVMSLVPPEELQSILGERPLAPLTDDEQRRIADLVADGFNTWREFHDRFSDQRLQELEPGQAGWDDLANFAKAYMGAQVAEGFNALRFRWEQGEIHDASGPAQVLTMKNGARYACGDFAGMPITGPDGSAVEAIGMNRPEVAEALREAAFPSADAGAAHVRWPGDKPLPAGVSRLPFGVLVASRQSIDLAARSELTSGLRVFVVAAGGEAWSVEGRGQGELIQTLLGATVRREPELAESLLSSLGELEDRCVEELRRPTESDRMNRIAHVVTPLLAAIVS